MWHKSAIFEKSSPPFLSNLNNFHSLEVVDRVSETQLQMGEFRLTNLSVKGLTEDKVYYVSPEKKNLSQSQYLYCFYYRRLEGISLMWLNNIRTILSAN